MAVEEDARAITNIYTPIVDNTHISFEITPPSVDEMAVRIVDTSKRFPWLVCEHDGEIIGYSYASPHKDRSAYQWGADVSVYVAEQWQQNGVARGLYKSLFALLRRQGFYTVYAVIALPNPPSVALHENFGFEQVAIYEEAGYKQGKWRNVGHWELVLQSHEIPPSPPTPFSELQHSEDVTETLRTGESLIRL